MHGLPFAQMLANTLNGESGVLTPEFIKGLTPSVALLCIVLWLVRAWTKDRNARIKDLQTQVNTVWEALRESERAREKDSEVARLSLDQAKTNEAVIQGLRTALSMKNGADS